MTIRTKDDDGFREALIYVLELHERGLIASLSAHLDPTGIGRISFATIGGAEINTDDIPGASGLDDTDKE